MATKKVEDKKKKVVTAKKKEKVVEAVVEEEKVICEECGKKYLASLNECPKCGYSASDAKKKKTFYDDDEFEEYDDEDEDYVPKKEVKKEVKKEKVDTKKKEEPKKEVKVEKKKKKEEKNVNKKVSIDNKKSMLSDDSNEIFNFIKILVVIVLLVGIVWVVASIFNKEEVKEDAKDDEQEQVATIQNDKILASSIFNKKDKTYYVFAYDASEENKKAEKYGALFTEYDSFSDKDKVVMFWVDLSDPLNKDVVAETKKDENKKPSKYENLSIYGPALIRIKNGKLDKYYDSDDAIEKIEKLIKSYRDKANEEAEKK